MCCRPRWGQQDALRALFPHHALSATPRSFVFRYASPGHWLDTFRTCYGPTQRAFATLATAQQQALEREILGLLQQFNRSGDQALVLPSTYLEVVLTTNA